MNADTLKQYLKKEGATLVGIGDITEALSSDILHLNRGVAIAVNRSLNQETVEMLSRLQGLAVEWLRSRGYLNLVIPPDSDRQKGQAHNKALQTLLPQDSSHLLRPWDGSGKTGL